MSCKIIRKFVYMYEHYRQPSSFTLKEGYIRVSGEKTESLFMFIHHNDPIKDEVYLFYIRGRYLQTYNGTIIDIGNMSLSDEELVLTYGRVVLDKEIISCLNSVIDVSFSDFSKFLEM